MNYLLTGATGFIGTYIMRQLFDRGDTVIGYDYNVDYSIIDKLFSEDEKSRLTIVRGDVRDLPKIIETCKKYDIDVIIHEATLLEIPSRNCMNAVDVNIKGTINIFEAARLLDIKRVIWASSQTVFGPQVLHGDKPIKNDDPKFPQTIYASTKVFLENISGHYNKQYGLEIIALRYSIVYGYGRSFSGGGAYAANLINAPAYGMKGTVSYGDDSPNWLYVKDAARATVKACDMKDVTYNAYTITGEIKSVREVKDFVKTIIPDADIEIIPGKFSSGWVFDTEQTEKELGYSPEYGIEAGVRETINYIKDELKHKACM